MEIDPADNKQRTSQSEILDWERRRDGIEAETAKLREVVQAITPEVKAWHEISDLYSVFEIVRTFLAIVSVVAVMRWAQNGGVYCAGFVFMAILQHRMNVIQHEAIHYLLFKNRTVNDWIGHHLFGAAILTPHTYRQYHFKHHRELGRISDPDRPGYTRFPTTRWGVLRFVLENLIGLGVVERFFAETKSAVAKKASIRAYHEQRGWISALQSWSIVGIVQFIILALFLVTGGTFKEFLIFWVLPELTLTRTLMAVRLMGEHVPPERERPEDMRYLVSLPCSQLERFLFAPMGFNFHAEHHLFPFVPWHRLEKLHRRLMEIPEYREVIDVRKGYLYSVFHNCLIKEKKS